MWHSRCLRIGTIMGTSLLTLIPVGIAEIRFDKNGLTGDFEKVQLRGRFSASVQGALIDPLEPAGDKEGTQVDGSARLSLEYTTDNAIVFGIAGEFDSGNEDIEGFERDELYIYAASDWGRIEIGENDGPADTLSYHAPATGLGQVRGDFARYEGRIAEFSPYDSRDAAKVTYLSPPINGFRAGVSYAPDFEINENDPNPLRRLIQQDVIEIAGQYNTVMQGTAIGVSAAYVTGSADNVTGRENIESWSVGAEATRGRVTIGGAYVDRGRSNLFSTSESRSEWNAGVEYSADKWSVVASTAISDDRGGTVSRYGIGGTYDLTENVYLATDLVQYEENFPGLADRQATVGILEIGVRY